MRNIYFYGYGSKLKFINEDTSEYRLGGGIIRCYELLSLILKKYDNKRFNIIDLDTKNCLLSYTIIEKEELVLKNNLISNNKCIPVTKNYNNSNDDLLIIVDYNGDYLINDHIKKIILLGKNALLKYQNIESLNNVFILDLKEFNLDNLSKDNIFTEIKKILNQYDFLYTALACVFFSKNYTILFEHKKFYYFYHNQETKYLYELSTTFLSGFIYGYSNDFYHATKIGIKFQLMYTSYLKNEEFLKKVFKTDLDIFVEPLEEKSDNIDNYYKMCEEIILYGFPALKIPCYKNNELIIINKQEIPKHHQIDFLYNMKKNFNILIEGSKYEDLHYLYKNHFKENNQYIFLFTDDMDDLFDFILSKNIVKEKPVIVIDDYKNAENKLLTDMLEKRYIKRKNNTLYLGDVIFICLSYETILEDLKSNFSIILKNDDFNDLSTDILKINRAIYIRRKLYEKIPQIFNDGFCQIDEESMSILLQLDLKYKEKEFENIINDIDVFSNSINSLYINNFNNTRKLKNIFINEEKNPETENINLSNNPKKIIPEITTPVKENIPTSESNEQFIESENGIINQLSLKCNESKSTLSKIINEFKKNNIYYRKNISPLQFSFTESEVENLARKKIQYLGGNYDILNDKERSKEKNFIKTLPRLFQEIGYELFDINA